MRTLKPAALSIISRCIEHRRQHFLGISVLTHMPLRGAPHLHSEQTLWPLLAEYAPGFVEEGIPRIRSEFLLYGRVHPPTDQPQATHADFGIRVAALAKKGRAHGRRVLQGGRLALNEPVTVTDILPGNSYGGPEYPDNPTGIGHPSGKTPEGFVFLPTIEMLDRPWDPVAERNRSALFCSLDIMHPSRSRHAGTYDDAWLKNDYPGLPLDASWLIYNTAPEDQRQEHPFDAEERFDLVHLHPDEPHLSGRLPGVQARVLVRRKGDAENLEDLGALLRTLVFLPEADRLVMIWQAQCRLQTDDVSDIDLLMVACEDAGRARPLSHYSQVIAERLDEEDGIMAMLDDAPLMPETITYDALLSLEQTPDEDPEGMNQRLRRRIERSMQAARDEVEAQGLNADEHAPPARLPAAAAPPPIDRIGPYMRELLERAEREIARIGVKQQADVAEAARLLEGQGLDGGLLEREVRGELGASGPPRPVAPETLRTLQDLDRQANERGEPNEDVARMLADTEQHECWRESDRRMLEGYRIAAHLQLAASPSSGERAVQQQQLIREGLAGGKGLRGLDLTGADLAGIDLSGQDCREVLLEGANLSGANLSRAILIDAVLAHADLTAARLEGCDLSRANLGKSRLIDTNLAGALLHETELAGARFMRTLLDGADLRDAQLLGLAFLDCEFKRTQLQGALFYECRLTGSSLREAQLDECQFIDCDLTGTRWQGCQGSACVFLNLHCSSCDFSQAALPASRWAGSIELSGVRFRSANLEQAYFGQESRLDGADFTGARLDGCDFTACVLDGAVCNGASMREASLRRTSLKNADLHGADLMNAILQNAQLQGCDLTGAHLYGADLARIHVDGQTRSENVVLTKARIYPRLQPSTDSP